ncbi:L-fucose:H+ symporter permease [Pedobacter frigoris]|uniref:L-fucose:H+ symporter permease n=1 Tax=Pedobacter frigoris TaxID=2571272 RepID=UPI00292E5C33|nr:L-fucose:H+ symporter permease [Pedobacter frigoris]
MTKNKYLFPFIMITSLFFMWGFVHNLDPILIPHLKRSFSLSTLEASLVDFSVFIAYFVMALPAGFIMKKYGYKSGIIIGLCLFAIGSFLFIPAANTQAYPFFLGALFIIACGLTILETAANPYASLLGPKETAPFRLNLSQSFNGLAAMLAPVIGSRIIMIKGVSDEELSTMSASAQQITLASEASSVKTPYLVLGAIILLITIVFLFIKLPEIKETEVDGDEKRGILHALTHKHLRWAVVAQFFYVGAQVCVLSLFVLYAAKAVGFDQQQAGEYAGYGMGLAFLIGRIVGTSLMKFIKAELLLVIYSVICVILCAFAMVTVGTLALISVTGVAFFMSIMFPTIFSLGIKDLGNDTKYGSSLIIMSIVGGALLPLVMGYISDISSIQIGYIVPLVCFLVVLAFGWTGHKVVKEVKNI